MKSAFAMLNKLHQLCFRFFVHEDTALGQTFDEK